MRIEGFGEKFFDLTTSRFVTQRNSIDSRHLDTFNVLNGSFVENADLFPNKFSNLEERIIRVALFNYKPYSIWMEVVMLAISELSFYTQIKSKSNIF